MHWGGSEGVIKFSDDVGTLYYEEWLSLYGGRYIQSEYRVLIHCEYTRNVTEHFADLNFDISCLMQCQNISQL